MQLDEIGEWVAAGRLEVAGDGRLAILDAPRRIDNATLFLYVRERRPFGGAGIQLLHYAAEDGRRVYKLRAHGSLDLHPLYETLADRLPAAGFGGRSAAGGSRPTEPCLPVVRDAVLELLQTQRAAPTPPVFP